MIDLMIDLSNMVTLVKKFLRDNDDIFVTKADKGQCTVIMNKKDYLEKMETLLSDEATYKKLNRDPCKTLTNKTSSLIKSWRDNGLIDDLT